METELMDFRIQILDVQALQRLIFLKTPELTYGHLAFAGKFDIVKNKVSKEDSYYYLLRNIPYSWPPQALIPQAREIFVDMTRPSEKEAGSFRDHHSESKEIVRDPSRSLFIGSLPFNVQDCGLLNLFSKYGTVETVQVLMDSITGKSKGFGFVTMSNIEEAETAKNCLNGVAMMDNGQTPNEYYSSIPREIQETLKGQLTVMSIIEMASKELIRLLYFEPDKLKIVEWRDLERIIAVLLQGLGYKVSLTRSGKDGGKDIIVEFMDSEQKKSYYIEIKHWVSGKKVGQKEIKEFLAVVVDEKPDKGIIISTSGFSKTGMVAITEIGKEKLRFGNDLTITNLCREYFKLNYELYDKIQFRDNLESFTAIKLTDDRLSKLD